MAQDPHRAYNRAMGFVDWLLPRFCRLCDREVERDIDLCAPCERSLVWNAHPCPRCALPGKPGACGPCRNCIDKAPPFTATFAPLLFEGPVRRWIHAAKSARGLGEAKLLSSLLARGVEQAGAAMPDALVPVPLTMARLMRRGHNQAILLAAPLARRFNVPMRRRAARRIRPGKPQRGQSRAARARSVRGVFAAPGPVHGHVVIVDDVMTTGATVTELASCLLTAGAGRVDVWAVARVPPAS